MLKKHVGSRLAVLAMGAVMGGVFACSSSNSPGFPESGDGGTSTSTATTSSGTTSGGYTGTTSGGTSSGYTGTSSGTTSGTTTGTTSSGTTSGTTSSTGGGTGGYTGTPDPNALAYSPAGMGGKAGYQMTVGSGGYGFTFSSDGAGCTSPATIDADTTAACFSGMTGTVSTASPYVCNGAGFGLNVAGMTGTTYSVSSTSAGINYNLSGYPSTAGITMRIQVTVNSPAGCSPSANTCASYCASISSGSGMVSWTDLTEECYNMVGGSPALAGPPSDLLNVEFTVNDGATPTSFNICVDSITF
jgi:hypothetical protein